MSFSSVNIPNIAAAQPVSPFPSPQDAWFWFMQANEARQSGARFSAGKGDIQRPCEPNDIMNVLNRLYRNRRLSADHLRVLAYYGERLTPPDPQEPRQRRAYDVWHEAMERLGAALEAKAIVTRSYALQEVIA